MSVPVDAGPPRADAVEDATAVAGDELTALGARHGDDRKTFEVSEDGAEGLGRLVEKEMVEALPLDVPIEVDINVADNWLDAH